MKETTMTEKCQCLDVPKRVSDRTLELAKLAGRAPHQIRQVDYERAKREIARDLPTGVA
jgi:hypothetical protein